MKHPFNNMKKSPKEYAAMKIFFMINNVAHQITTTSMSNFIGCFTNQ